MYESPVELFDVTEYTKKVNDEIDNYIYGYIVKLGINVNKEELIKALQYDRAQYEKGYKDGLKGTEWRPYPDEKPTETKEYNITIKNPKHTTTAAYFTEDDTWYGGNDLYVPRECISAWAELPKSFEENDDEDPDLVARQILAKLSGLSVDDSVSAHTQKIIFGNKPAEKCWSLTGDYFENDVLATEAVHDNKDKVIVVELDCLMSVQRAAAFRKELLAQMKEGLIVIPPWAHVAYVGDECTIEVKGMKEELKYGI